MKFVISKIMKLSGWQLLSSIIVAIIVFPNIYIVLRSFVPANESWYHIKQFLLSLYLQNTFALIISVGIITAFVGVLAAWLVTVFEFPGRKIFAWALMLPLAIPPYIGAYTYNGILNYTGIVQETLRNIFDININQKLLSITNIRGVIFIFVIFLFPYVYMTTRSYLRNMSESIIETSRMLGQSLFKTFFKVIIPLARVAIVGGVSLTILEVLNDYGVVKYFGVPVFSTAIYNTWFGMGDVDSAIKLATHLMILVIFLYILEKLIQGRKRYSSTTSKLAPIRRIPLSGSKKIITTLYCFMLVLLGFIIPVAQLVQWTSLAIDNITNVNLAEITLNTIYIAAIASTIITISALIIANYTRITNGLVSKVYAKLTIIGYSIPASIVSIGVMTTFLFIDRRLNRLYLLINPEIKRLVLSTSLIMLIVAYFIRFLAIGFNPVEAAFTKIGKRYHETARTLGRNPTRTFFEVDLPMIKASAFTSFIMVFVDVLKELPLTLILRPFNFNTLATRVFEYANDEMIHEASIASLVIIIVSVLAIYWFNRLGAKEEQKWQ